MDVSRNAYIGQEVERVEDFRFLTGRGTFVDDYEPAGVLHAAILRSSVAHGRIVSIDTSAASEIPGVHAIITAADVGEQIPTIPIRLAPIAGLEKYLQPVIAREKVRYVGEPIAVILAESRAIAEDAANAIDLAIDPLGPIPNWRTSETDETLLFEQNGTNVATRYAVGFGDTDTVFANSDYSRREFFRAHRHTAVPMETRGVVAEWDADKERLIVNGATKVTFFNRRALAAMLGMAESAIDLIELDVGGGFGVRGEFYPEDFLIPFSARKFKRPVKWIEDRLEHFQATNHSREIDCELEIACRRDGTILALRGRIFADMGAYTRTNSGVVPAKAAQFLHGPYRIPAVKIEVAAFMTSKTPVGTYRAPGRFESNFFRERLIDMAARDLGIDPLEMRRRNLITTAEMPYSIGKLVPYENETAYDTGDYEAALDECLQAFGWEEKEKMYQGRNIGGRYHGLGIACFVESGGAGPRENVRMTLEADGHITLAVGSSVLGQGLETVFAQIAADAMSLPLESFHVLHGSTTIVDEGFGTYHSRAVVMGGSAILDGAKNLLASIQNAAGLQFNCPPEDVTIQDGSILGPDGRRSTFAALAAAAGPVSATGTFANNKRTYSYGAHAAHVSVDPRTGHVAVLDYVAVEDVGRAINPALVHGQTFGAVVQGLGGVFLDHLIYDDNAQLLNASLADYLLPTATDFPNIRGVTMQLHLSPSNPLGAKGAGEGGMVAVAATAANAVAAALAKFDVQPNELPLSPPRVWALIQKSNARSI
jgi:aerobic carbon-monoxide dehydrogenase large subunit